MQATRLIGSCTLIEASINDDIDTPIEGDNSYSFIKLLNEEKIFDTGAFVSPAHAILTFTVKSKVVLRIWDRHGNFQKKELLLNETDPDSFYQFRISAEAWVSITIEPGTTATMCIYANYTDDYLQKDPKKFFEDEHARKKYFHSIRQ